MRVELAGRVADDQQFELVRSFLEVGAGFKRGFWRVGGFVNDHERARGADTLDVCYRSLSVALLYGNGADGMLVVASYRLQGCLRVHHVSGEAIGLAHQRLDGGPSAFADHLGSGRCQNHGRMDGVRQPVHHGEHSRRMGLAACTTARPTHKVIVAKALQRRFEPRIPASLWPHQADSPP